MRLWWGVLACARILRAASTFGTLCLWRISSTAKVGRYKSCCEPRPTSGRSRSACALIDPCFVAEMQKVERGDRDEKNDRERRLALPTTRS